MAGLNHLLALFSALCDWQIPIVANCLDRRVTSLSSPPAGSSAGMSPIRRYLIVASAG